MKFAKANLHQLADDSTELWLKNLIFISVTVPILWANNFYYLDFS